MHNWPERFNVARAELFESAWRKFPTVLETSHYHEALRGGAYSPTPLGSIRAYDDLRGAIRLTHAAYLGCHGDARKWLSDHSALAKELANRLDYWYFPKSLSMPQSLVAGRENAIRIDWENKSTAPALSAFRPPRKADLQRMHVIRDIAEVAATVLTNEGRYGKTYDLNGPDVLSGGQRQQTFAAKRGQNNSLSR